MNKIMIVDPDSVSLKQLNMQLTAGGFETMIFDRPADALAAAEVFRPELIISEINIPEMNGFAFLSEVRKIERMVRIPFIFLSYQADTQTKIKAFESTADEFIAKPYEFKDLLVRLNLQIKLRKDPYYNPETNTSGDLRSNPLRLIFDNIRMKKQSGILRVVHWGETSFVGFKDGEIVYAKSINRIGKQAIFYLFTLQTGKFKFDEGEKIPNRNVLDSYGPLMVLAEKISDVAGKILPRYTGTSRIIYVEPALILQLGGSTDIKDSNLAKLFETCQSLQKVINYTEYGVLEVLKLLQQYLSDKRLIIENTSDFVS
ncbi:MAG: response regulator [Bacteroidetes bacterium]|nr:response regulator [Bacteroidota bacterium]